ncbi:MAG: PAS domain S-box protein [Desulfocucumaceae bacterium]
MCQRFHLQDFGILRVYKTGESKKIFDWNLIKKSGEIGYLEASIALIKDNEGRGTGFRCVVRDITERRQVD